MKGSFLIIFMTYKFIYSCLQKRCSLNGKLVDDEKRTRIKRFCWKRGPDINLIGAGAAALWGVEPRVVANESN